MSRRAPVSSWARARLVNRGAAVVAARLARAALDERGFVVGEPGLGDVEAEAALGVGAERRAVAGEAGGDGAVEQLDAEADSGEIRSSTSPIPSRWPAEPLRGGAEPSPRGHRSHLARLSCARVCRRLRSRRRRQRRSARPTRASDPRRPRPGRSRTPPARPGPVVAVPVEAAVEPPVGALGRAGGVVAVGAGRVTLNARAMSAPSLAWIAIDSSGPRKRLDPSRSDWKLHAALGDVDLRQGPASPAPPALDLVGDSRRGRARRPGSRPSRDERAPPHPMNPCSPPCAAIRSSPGEEVEVESVAEHELVAERRHLRRGEPAHARLGRERDEGRRPYLAVRGTGRPARAEPSRALISKLSLPGSDLTSIASVACRVIASGWAIPSSAQGRSGATSARIAGRRREAPTRSEASETVTISGTGLVVWAVFGRPCSSRSSPRRCRGQP